jgi:hypothetical protein
MFAPASERRHPRDVPAHCWGALMRSATGWCLQVSSHATTRLSASKSFRLLSGQTSLARVVRSSILVCVLGQSALLNSTAGRAAEFAQSTYLLGLGSSLAGVTPPPGIYFQMDNYFYSGRIGGGRQLSFGPAVGVNVLQRTWLDVPTTLLVMPVDILGGSLGFAASAPLIGVPSVNPIIQVDFPRLNRAPGTSITEAKFNVGDIYIQSFLGWQRGDFHWQLGAMSVAPSGSYNPESFSNVSLNRPAADLFGAFTWLDQKGGHEISAKAGVTFNGKNYVNQYRTGNEFHLEWAAMQHFSPEFAIGLVGYHYQQLSGDSGQGAKLGPFKGRVTALGGEADITFKLGELPVSTKLRVYQEFNTKNRFEGTVGILTIAVPLAVAPAPAAKAMLADR